MDYTILLFCSVSFICLLCSLPIVFRIVHTFDALSWYLRLTVFIASMHTIVWFRSGYGLEGYILMELIYLLFCIFFLFGIFGMLEASITLHLLLKIGTAKNQRTHESELLHVYNKKHIIQKRLARFVWTRDITETNNSYELVPRPSLYQMREYLLNFLKWLYP